MSRLHKKCLFASAAMHSLFLAMLVLSPALVPSTREPDLPVLTLIPTRVTDEPFFGGGPPNAAAPSAPPASQSQPPRVEIIPPREPEPIRPDPEPRRKAEPKQAPEKATTKPSLEKASKQKPPSEKPSKKPYEIKPTFKKSSDNSKAIAAAKAKAEAEARAERARYSERVNRLSEYLSKGLSPGIGIEMPGLGGEAYANYGQVVKSKYYNAWLPPDELADGSATVEVNVVILRDGNVKSATILKPSGIPALDSSVNQALKMDFIAPFPPGAKDTERTFLLNFSPKIKKRPFG